ncbi:MAG: hypothetical protein M0Q91_06395 [Methanoregula sp.]|nr:hypothetical protein [Methanoregula sp.]
MTDRRMWEKILVAVSCAIIISWIALFIINPEHRIVVGTCGPDTIPMTYSTNIQPTFEESFLHEFGNQEPVLNPGLPPMKRYVEKQQVIDTLMDRARVTGPPDSIIGLYEFPDARLLLINQNASITEVLETGRNLQTFALAPVPAGSRHYEDNGGANVKHGDYNFSSAHSVTINRIDLVLPSTGNVTAPFYIVNKTESEQIFDPDGNSFAAITTTGTFYVLYGQRVERVTGSSAILLDPAWKQCSPRMEISGEGSGTGEVKHTVKLARSSERLLRSLLITTSAHIQVYDAGGGSTSQWMSSDLWFFKDGTGCSC